VVQWPQRELKMGRKQIEFDKDCFVQLFEEIQADSVGEHCQKLAEVYNNKMGTNIKTQMFYLRAKEWGLTFQKVSGLKQDRENKPKKSKKKLKINLVKWPKDQLLKYKSVIDRAENGSYKAFIKLKCISCSNFQQKEVRLCGVDTCEIYPIRPYRGKGHLPTE